MATRISENLPSPEVIIVALISANASKARPNSAWVVVLKRDQIRLGK
jgi:hypothetical protein